MEIQGEPVSQEFLNFAGQSTWTSFNKPFKPFVFYSYILIWNAFRVVVELPAIFTLNFCYVFLFNLSHKNFWTFSGRALELLAKKLFSLCFFILFFHTKCTLCSTWTSGSYHSELLSVTWKYMSFLWIFNLIF